jgi:predicted NodU family carbamoyl transferase
MSWILGIGGYSDDASAALLKDGKLIAAVQGERLTRIKHAGGFPYASGLFERTFGPLRREGEPLDERHADIAASVQRLFEEVVLHLSLS